MRHDTRCCIRRRGSDLLPVPDEQDRDDRMTIRLAAEVRLARIEDRFWAKVQKGEGCWTWTGSLWPAGYGRSVVDGHQLQAHRRSWALTHGPIPAGMDVLHICDNPPCVRPDHLYLGTDVENSRDRVTRGRAARQIGESNARAVLTREKVDWLRRQHASGTSYAELARALGVSHGTVRFAVKGVTWK